jgi:hypothetical protein
MLRWGSEGDNPYKDQNYQQIVQVVFKWLTKSVLKPQGTQIALTRPKPVPQNAVNLINP